MFSRKNVIQLKPLDLREVVGNMSKMLRRLLGETILLKFNPPPALPPVDRVLPPTRVGLVARALYVAGRLPLLPAERLEHDAARSDAVAEGETAEYGAYLALTGGCVGCHGTGLSDGRIPGTPPIFPPATNLTPPALAGWSEADFARAIGAARSGDLAKATAAADRLKELSGASKDPRFRYFADQMELQRQAALGLIALAGAAMGFLVFNRRPARVFLGDTGSLPLGGLLGWAALAWSAWRG